MTFLEFGDRVLIDQSIFCVSNLTNSLKKISLLNINLISTNEWFDIISQKKIKNQKGNIIFKPYQTYWLTNKAFLILQFTKVKILRR